MEKMEKFNNSSSKQVVVVIVIQTSSQERLLEPTQSIKVFCLEPMEMEEKVISLHE
jgi:hypothetical protein